MRLYGLSWCHLCGTALRDENEPSRYKSLPEGSVLKAIVDALITFEMSTQANLLEAILGSLVDQRRKSDERVLPPLDWRFLYSYCNMKYAALEPLLIALSIQQHAYKKWAQKIPPIVSAVSIRHAMFETFVDFEIPEHTYSNNAMLALWALTKCVSRVDLRSVVHFLKLIAREKRPTCFLILAYNFGKLLVEDRITLMLQLVSISRLDSQSSKDDFIYWRIFVTLCNVDRSSEIPVALFSSCDQVTWNRVESRVCEHFRALRSVAKFCAEVSKISYLFMDVLLAMRADQNCGSEMLRKTAKALLRTALAIDTKRLIENLEETHLWNEVFT
ncbi:unnamed protein product [Toxocara canis]|uniref:NopRA1 domain-containing protein n=1 Tax=Toxocara canis TaxID=6265 RepID=A0A183UZP1_TOXCA|nr:unnamed protein product [Toxocara canis]